MSHIIILSCNIQQWENWNPLATQLQRAYIGTYIIPPIILYNKYIINEHSLVNKNEVKFWYVGHIAGLEYKGPICIFIFENFT